MPDTAHGHHEIVLVEDDAGVRRAIARILGSSGWHVAVFDSAEALQEELAGGPLWSSCRCLVCDVRLPGASGFELHWMLSALGAIPSWIFITAHDEPSLRRQAERSGALYLLKPFAGRSLLALVERAMHGRGFSTASGG